MKRIVVISVILCFLWIIPSNAQVGKFLKNVKNSVTQDLLGGKDNNKGNEMPEPDCACDPGELIMEMGKLQIDYSEMNIDVLEDGSILLRDNMNDSYFIHKNGSTDGPFKSDNPKVKQFQAMLEMDLNPESILTYYKDYITKKDDKYLITFGGKQYGPYAQINKFTLSKSKDKFAAIVVETIIMSDDEGNWKPK